jgi:hypothetical protein
MPNAQTIKSQKLQRFHKVTLSTLKISSTTEKPRMLQSLSLETHLKTVKEVDHAILVAQNAQTLMTVVEQVSMN